jgi:hypothetical protein
MKWINHETHQTHESGHRINLPFIFRVVRVFRGSNCNLAINPVVAVRVAAVDLPDFLVLKTVAADVRRL